MEALNNGSGRSVKRVINNRPTATHNKPRRGYCGHKRPTRDRARMAADVYDAGQPIARPTLAQAAFAYRVPLAAVLRARNGHNKKTQPTLAEHLANATPAERVEAARAIGVDRVWDEMILPLVGGNGKAPERS
jgi:hypothetical protein